MVKEKDFFLFLYAWIGALKDIKNIVSTQVTLAEGEDTHIIKNLFLVCLYGTIQEQKKAFNNLPSVEYKKFFDFLLDKNNINFMLGISKGVFDFSIPMTTLNENIFKVFGGLPIQYDVFPKMDYSQVAVLPALKVSFDSKYVPNVFYTFIKKHYKVSSTCAHKRIVDYLKRRTKDFKDVIIYFSYYKFAQSDRYIFFPMLISNSHTVLHNNKMGVHHIADADESLIKVFAPTASIAVKEPIYSLVSSVESVFTKDVEFTGGVYLYGIKGFVYTALKYSKCCTFPSKYIKNRNGKTSKVAFLLDGKEVVKDITLQYRKIPRKLLYLETRVYHLPDNTIKYVPIKLKRKESTCKFCGSFVREARLPYCGKCRGRISKFLREKDVPSICTTTSKVLRVLEDIEETKITVIGRGTKYMLSATSGKVIMVKRFKI